MRMPSKRQRPLLVCAHCGMKFVRDYYLSASRTRRVFCSTECRNDIKAREAKASIEKRFWSKVQIGHEDECWPYMGRRNESNYGLFDAAPKDPWLASRFALFLSTGVDPGELCALHRCDNPPCCNPKHLYAGTKLDNIRDMDARGRRNPQALRGEDHLRAKLTNEQALEIYRSKDAAKDISKKYDISLVTVYQLRRGETWSHVTGAKNANVD